MSKQQLPARSKLHVQTPFNLGDEKYSESFSDPSKIFLDDLPPFPTYIHDSNSSLMEAIATNSPTIDSLNSLGLSHLQQGGLTYHYKEGIKLYNQRKYQESIAQFDKSLEFSDEFANAHYNKALALKALGRYDESMAEHEKAIELKPKNILYLCSQAKLYLAKDDRLSALECFDRAYEISADGTPQTSYTEENLEFVRRTLLERSELLAKIKHIQTTSIESQKIINAYLDQDHPAFHEAVTRFHHLRELKLSLIEQFMDNLYQDDSPLAIDLSAPAKEVVVQAQEVETQPLGNASRRNSENVQILYKNIHNLTAQVTRLENEFVTQQEEFFHMLEDQQHLQTRTAEQDALLEHQGAQIQRLEDFAETFKMAQEKLEVIVHKLEEQGVADTNRTLNQISALKRNLVSILPVDFDLDEYQYGFFYTLKQDLIAAQSAASLVTNTNIIRNNKTGTAGRIGDILDVAGDLIPSIGGCVQFLAAIINTADHAHQQALVGKLAGMAKNPSEMERIAHTIAKILSDPQYFDKSLIESHPQLLKSKIMNYISSFIEELSDGTQSSTINSVEGRVAHPKEEKPLKKKDTTHSRHKSLPDDEFPIDPANDLSTKSSKKLGLFSFSRKSKQKDDAATIKTKTISASDDETDPSSSTQSFEFMSSRGSSESAKQKFSSDDKQATSSKTGFGWLTKTKKSSTESPDEKITISAEEQTGINNAHIISKTIINLMYENLIPSRSMQVTEHVIIERILMATFTKLELDPTIIPTVLSEEFAEQIDLSQKRDSTPAPISEKKLEAQKLAKEVLDEVAAQVELSREFYNSAFHALTSRIDTYYSSAKIPIIESIMKSSTFKEVFIDRLIATIVKQFRETGDHKITLDSARAAMKEAEAALREEKDDFPIDSSREVLVWQCLIKPDNPFLKDPNFIEQAMKIISIDESSKLLTLGHQEPELAEDLLREMKKQGTKPVLDIIFGHAADSPEASAIAGDVIEHAAAEVA
jgi:tetratricopeptide (TPR) repeat protein